MLDIMVVGLELIVIASCHIMITGRGKAVVSVGSLPQGYDYT
jgi:hypothetical protein